MFAHPKVYVKAIFTYHDTYVGSIGWYKFDSYRGEIVMHVKPGATCDVNKEWT